MRVEVPSTDSDPPARAGFRVPLTRRSAIQPLSGWLIGALVPTARLHSHGSLIRPWIGASVASIAIWTVHTRVRVRVEYGLRRIRGCVHGARRLAGGKTTIVLRAKWAFPRPGERDAKARQVPLARGLGQRLQISEHGLRAWGFHARLSPHVPP
jgi:hypothetical protein